MNLRLQNLRFRHGALHFRMNLTYLLGPHLVSLYLVFLKVTCELIVHDPVLFTVASFLFFVAPKLVNNYLQSLKSREESLREQLEKAKKKEAAFIVTFAKREQEIAELKSAVLDLKAQLHLASMQYFEDCQYTYYFVELLNEVKDEWATYVLDELP
ncbi:hypothetical protein RIF29_14277 [Crotalaria pallida]|uniref:Uncharacterized protein n=1 Tax=Crotalaria pallida TaxID=3830 RepID=A0AAN9FJR8_CROPI